MTERPFAIATPSVHLTQAYMLGAPAPVANALVPVAVNDVERELAMARQVGKVASEGFAQAALGVSGFSRTATQKVSQALHSDSFEWGSILGLIGAGLAGAGTCAALEHFMPGSGDLATWAGWGVFGVAAALEGVALTVRSVTGRIAKRQRDRRVEPNDIEPVVARLEQLNGPERVVAGKHIAQWCSDLNSRRALTPPARERLEAAAAALRPDGNAAYARLDQLKAIADIMDSSEQLTWSTIAEARRAIDALEPAERHRAAVLVADAVRDSKRPKDYEAEHQAHALPKNYVAASEPQA